MRKEWYKVKSHIGSLLSRVGTYNDSRGFKATLTSPFEVKAQMWLALPCMVTVLQGLSLSILSEYMSLTFKYLWN